MKWPPPKTERLACQGESSQTERQLQQLYWLVSLLQVPVERIYWWLEQKRARLQDQLANNAGVEA
jgi:hypothetical protein